VAKGLPVDTSVMRTRRQLRRSKRDTLEWGTPVLYLRSPDGRIFNPTATPPTSTLPTLPDDFGERHDQAGPDPLEALYDEALAAYWTERWDQAVELLRQVVIQRRDDADAAGKLEWARRQQQLATRYAQARADADAQDWSQAIAGFAMVVDADPGYQDAQEQLAQARRLQQLTSLQEEARRLHRAKQWTAVVKIGERLQTLDPDAADPDGLVTSARAQIAAAEREQLLTSHYRSGLRHLDAGAFQQALEELQQVERMDPAYRDIQALLTRVRQELAQIADAALTDRYTTGLGQLDRGAWAEAAATFSALHNDRADYRDTAALLARARQRVPQPIATPNTAPSFRLNPRTLQVGRSISVLALSPDGTRLATGKGRRVAVWDLRTGAKKWDGQVGGMNPDVRVTGMEFSPDSTRLVTASTSGKTRIWDAATGREQLVVNTHTAWQMYEVDVAFSPDGARLATAVANVSGDERTRIWDAATGQEQLLVPHSEKVVAAAFSPDGARLATTSNDKTARIWTLDEGSGDGPA
jgi:tetratricopeptide (TPR) repeat protein